MTSIACAATNCVHNGGGVCQKDDITLVFLGGSDERLDCEDYEPRPDGNARRWIGVTDPHDDRAEERPESVAAYHQHGREEKRLAGEAHIR